MASTDSDPWSNAPLTPETAGNSPKKEAPRGGTDSGQLGSTRDPGLHGDAWHGTLPDNLTAMQALRLHELEEREALQQRLARAYILPPPTDPTEGRRQGFEFHLLRTIWQARDLQRTTSNWPPDYNASIYGAVAQPSPKDGGPADPLAPPQHAHALFTVPLNPQRDRTLTVLDVGCGTGQWAHEVARWYPEAWVTGVDRTAQSNPIGRYDPQIAARVRTAQLNILLDDDRQKMPPAQGPDREQRYQYIHQSLLAAGIPRTAWFHVITRLLQLTAPGGWIELVEWGMPPIVGPASARTAKWLTDTFNFYGLDAQLGDLLASGDQTYVTPLRLTGWPYSITSTAVPLAGIPISDASTPTPTGASGSNRLSQLARTNLVGYLQALFPWINEAHSAQWSQVRKATFDQTLGRLAPEYMQAGSEATWTLHCVCLHVPDSIG